MIRLFYPNARTQINRHLLRRCSKSAFSEQDLRIQELQQLLRNQIKSKDYESAKTTAIECLDECTLIFTNDHPVTASSYNNLALVHKNLGENLKLDGKFQESELEYEKSAECYEAGLKIYQTILGEDHLHTASIHANLAVLYRIMSEIMGRRYAYLELGREHCLRAMEIRRDKSGGDDPYYLWSKFTYGTILASEEKNLDAQETLAETLRSYRKAVGKTHGLATMLNDISLFYEHVGNADLSLRLMEECLEVREEILGPDHPECEYTRGVLEYLKPKAEEVLRKRELAEAKQREKEKAKEKRLAAKAKFKEITDGENL